MARENVNQGEGVDVGVIRAKAPEAKPQPVPADTAPPTSSTQLARLDALAKAAGMLPEFLATGVTSRPVDQNPKFWIYRAICVRYRWNEHSLISQQDFDAAAAAVANFSV